MKVTMLRDVHGAVDGVEMGPYRIGQQVELDDDVAMRFVNSAMAVIPVVEVAEPVATTEEIADNPHPRWTDGSEE